MSRWRDLLQPERSTDRHRELARTLQHQAAALCAWLSTTGTTGDQTTARPDAHHELTSHSAWYKISVRPPRYFPLGEGKSYQLGRIKLTFKTSAIDSSNAYTLCEAIEPPEAGAGLHRHASYDETHIVCEGQYEARLGN